MGVSRRSLAVLVAMLAVLAVTSPLLAKPDRVQLNLARSLVLAGTTLHAGDYEVVIDGNKVSFVQNRKVMAEATGEWKKADQKDSATSLTYSNGGQITEIHLRGHDSYLAIR